MNRPHGKSQRARTRPAKTGMRTLQTKGDRRMSDDITPSIQLIEDGDGFTEAELGWEATKLYVHSHLGPRFGFGHTVAELVELIDRIDLGVEQVEQALNELVIDGEAEAMLTAGPLGKVIFTRGAGLVAA